MNEKRFRLREPTIDDTIGCSEISDNGEWITYGEIVELLNELAEENQFLNKQLNIYRDASKVDARENKELLEDIDELYEENQQLRKLLDIGKTNAKDIVDVLNAQQNTIKELTKENEELKKEMRIKDALSIAEWVKKNIKYGKI